jgi:hypothetical protein
MVAIIASAAVAQSRIYSAGSSGPSGPAFNDNSNRGATPGNSNQGGMVLNARGAGGTVAPGRAPVTQPAATPAAAAPQTTRVNTSRPTFIAIDPERERFEHRRHHPPHDVFQPFPYGVYTNPPSDEDYYRNYTSFTDQQQPVEQVAEPETPAPTIFENRPGYQPPPVRAYQPTSSPSQVPGDQPNETGLPSDGNQRVSAVDPQPTTILVFRDGHQLEIGNYAVVGDTLYNMAGTNETHKILLTDLDLDKTIKVNQARGYDFRLPKRQS